MSEKKDNMVIIEPKTWIHIYMWEYAVWDFATLFIFCFSVIKEAVCKSEFETIKYD